MDAIAVNSVCVAGLHMPSRASSGALHRLSALRHMVRTQRPARAMSARNLQKLFAYGMYACLFPCESALYMLSSQAPLPSLLLPCSERPIEAIVWLQRVGKNGRRRRRGC